MFDHPTRKKLFPVDQPIADRSQPNTRLTHRVDPITGLDGVEPSETVLIPTQDDIEVPAITCVVMHLLELHTLTGRVAGNSFVAIIADDPIAVVGSVPLDGFRVVLECLFLAYPKTCGNSRLPESDRFVC